MNSATMMREMACTVGKSLVVVDSSRSWPMPPTLNADSTRTVVTSSVETISPPVVSTVPSALRNTCRRITRCSATPRLRATVTCSWPSTSSIAVRVTRASMPIR